MAGVRLNPNVLGHEDKLGDEDVEVQSWQALTVQANDISCRVWQGFRRQSVKFSSDNR